MGLEGRHVLPLSQTLSPSSVNMIFPNEKKIGRIFEAIGMGIAYDDQEDSLQRNWYKLGCYYTLLGVIDMILKNL